MPKKNVKILIKSHMTDLTAIEDSPAESRRSLSAPRGTVASLHGSVEHGDSILNINHNKDNEDGEDAHGHIVYSTEGTLDDSGDRIEISYEESELIGMDGSMTTLIFDKSSPDIITVTRQGEMRSGLVFNAAGRNICLYDIDDMPLEFCVLTHSVTNALTYDGGVIKLDYDVEVHGVKTERNRFAMYVSDFTEDASRSIPAPPEITQIMPKIIPIASKPASNALEVTP